MASPKSSNVFTFKIGDAFPADDPVARFLVAVAMMSNDLLRLVDWMLENEGQDTALRLFSFRIQTALFFEASTFLRETPGRWSAVKHFVDALDSDVRTDLERVTGATDPGSATYLGPWVKDNRNLTFHYKDMRPERPPERDLVWTALRRCQDADGEISVGDGSELRTVRFGFADTVAVQWFPDVDDPGALIEELRGHIVALVGLAHRMIVSYIGQRPDSDRAMPDPKT